MRAGSRTNDKGNENPPAMAYAACGGWLLVGDVAVAQYQRTDLPAIVSGHKRCRRGP